MQDEAHENHPYIAHAHATAHDAIGKDLQFVSPVTKLIDIPYDEREGTLYPEWYENPPPIEIPTDNILTDTPYTERIYLRDVVFHVRGTEADFYEGLTVAKVAYCLLKGNKPVIVAVDNSKKQVVIPLSQTTENVDFVTKLARLKKQEQEAVANHKLQDANNITRVRDTMLISNQETALISTDISVGRSLASVGIRASGGAYAPK